jgi:hypothetical protein
MVQVSEILTALQDSETLELVLKALKKKGAIKTPKGKSKTSKKVAKDVILTSFNGGGFKPFKTKKGLELSLNNHVGCIVKNNKDIQKVDVKNIQTLINLINKGATVTLITSSKKERVYISQKKYEALNKKGESNND